MWKSRNRNWENEEEEKGDGVEVGRGGIWKILWKIKKSEEVDEGKTVEE